MSFSGIETVCAPDLGVTLITWFTMGSRLVFVWHAVCMCEEGSVKLVEDWESWCESSERLTRLRCVQHALCECEEGSTRLVEGRWLLLVSRQCLKQFEGVHPFAEYYARVVVDWQTQWESREGSARLVGVRHKLYLLRRLSKVSTDQQLFWEYMEWLPDVCHLLCNC